MAQSTMSITIKLPWWWRLYLGSLVLMHALGMLRPDPDVAAAFIVRHIKFYLGGRRI